ncbi:hypothetical protein [Sorangium sp. So ce1099]
MTRETAPASARRARGLGWTGAAAPGPAELEPAAQGEPPGGV